jgi:hypothetical protein
MESEFDSETPSGRVPENMDVSLKAVMKVTKSCLVSSTQELRAHAGAFAVPDGSSCN